MSTASLLLPPYAEQHNQLMVDKPAPRSARLRFQAAPAPDGYASFRTWLIDTVEPPGIGKLKAELGRFINEALQKDTGPQLVNSYLKRGSIPEWPVVRAIAQWAQVDFSQLQLLVHKQEEAKQLAPKSGVSTGTVRRKGKRTSSPKRARLAS
jgi:hypothetical protein